MLILKLVYSKGMEFDYKPTELQEILKKKNIRIGIKESLDSDNHIIEFISAEDIFDKSIINKIYLYVSNIIYRYVILQYQQKEIFQFLIENYFFLKHDEIVQIIKKVIKLLNMEERPNEEIFIYCYNKINTIIEKIKKCIEENNEINIDGFITFRMKELAEDIESIIDRIVEKYIVEKEYEEFIRLLKYFVDIQDSKIEEVNIYIKPLGVYNVTDSTGKDIFSIMLKDLSDSDLNIVNANIEDILISGLITNAPEKIVIHGESQCINKEFLNTILNVFGDRVEFCKTCEVCKINYKKC
jgi:putative sporulation protein YtxC